jgi:hypothetical protein
LVARILDVQRALVGAEGFLVLHGMVGLPAGQ